ncbi:MAG: phosphoenolpyruvate carboxykinase domain-containing protein [Planctomycetota bacterium]|jgi:phosphoenolpyruvate carboxykinase (GTP)
MVEKLAETKSVLQERIDPQNLEKLNALGNDRLNAFIAEAIELTNPETVLVFTDSKEDIETIREKAKNGGGEHTLATAGHTYHFDGPKDQARDKANTKYLLPEGMDLGASLNSTDKVTGLAEVKGILKDSYKGKEMLICFFCLGPTNSDFSISCAQITDSYYVAHSECLLYRPGYEQFKKVGDGEFFRFVHTQGETDENGCSVNVDGRRVYVDLEDNIVFSTNTQYAGNTVGLKKLSLRLAIQKSSKEGWLAEHMFIMGVNGPNGRKTYFTGAFPSACGKTSTAMLPGQTIVGDDIAYLRKKNGKMMTANVEQGIFGIIENVNADDDPVIFESLNSPGEVIFGNVLISDGKPYWMGLDNVDPELENPNGVEAGGIIYGGRDSDTQVPVEQAFDWAEGIIAKGASIESETTAATLGQAGVRTFNIMANQDFVAIPLGQYIQNNLDFANGVDKVPSIFSTNYFLKGEDGQFLNGKLDKMIWVLWAELRVNGDVEAIKTPTGWIPKYEDLAPLFKEKLNKDYTQDEYVQQFTVRVPNLLAKYDRVEAIYKEKVADTPQLVYDTFSAIRKRLKDLQAAKGDFVSPLDL